MCTSCCPPDTYHCPFCLPHVFRPTTLPQLQVHLENHLKAAVYIGNHTVHRCALECRATFHYHCLYCESSLLRRRNFRQHMMTCHYDKPYRALIFSQLNTEAVQQPKSKTEMSALLFSEGGDIPTSFKKSSNNGYEEITFSLDSEDQISHGAEGNLTIFGNEGITVRGKSSKSRRTDETNFEKPQDCDEFYFMSLVKMFKKLSPQKKADVRLKIERLLFEAEFE